MRGFALNGGRTSLMSASFARLAPIAYGTVKIRSDWLEDRRHGEEVLDAHRDASRQSLSLQLRFQRVVHLSRRMHDGVTAVDELLARHLVADRRMIGAHDAHEGMREQPLLIQRRARELGKVAERQIDFAGAQRRLELGDRQVDRANCRPGATALRRSRMRGRNTSSPMSCMLKVTER